MCQKKKCLCIKPDEHELDEEYGMYARKVVWPLDLDKIKECIDDSLGNVILFEDFLNQKTAGMIETLNAGFRSPNGVSKIDIEVLNTCFAYLFTEYLMLFKTYPKKVLYKESLNNLHKKGNFGISEEQIERYIDEKFPSDIYAGMFADLGWEYRDLLPQVDKIMYFITDELRKGTDVLSIVNITTEQIKGLGKEEILVLIFCSMSNLYHQLSLDVTSLINNLFKVYKNLSFVHEIYRSGLHINETYFEQGFLHIKNMKKQDLLDFGLKEKDYEYVKNISDIYHETDTQYKSARDLFSRMKVNDVLTKGFIKSPISLILFKEYFSQDYDFQKKFESCYEYFFHIYEEYDIETFYHRNSLKKITSLFSAVKTMNEENDKVFDFCDYKSFIRKMLRSYRKSNTLKSKYARLDSFLEGTLQYLWLIEFEKLTIQSLLPHLVLTSAIKNYFIISAEKSGKK